MDNAYSHMKAFRHMDVIQSIKAGKPSRLPHIQLILADLCQQSCKFCAYRLEGYASNQLFDERRMMPLEKALEIVDDAAELGVRAVQFTGGGEPTLHKGFPEVAMRVIERGMRFGLVTNGVRLMTMLTVAVEATWVRVSLDSATEETYCKIRRVHKSHWTSAQDSVRALRMLRDKTGHQCQIGIGFVVTPDNWHEVVDAAKLAKELGADNFRISAQFSNEDEKLFEGFYNEASGLCKQAQSISCSGFIVYNRFGDRLDDLKFKNPEDRICGYQFFNAYIGADLNIYRCCGYAYNTRGLVGSIANKRFKDFWLEQERFDNQWNFDGRGCDKCQFRKINSALAYTLSPESQMHEEFV